MMAEKGRRQGKGGYGGARGGLLLAALVGAGSGLAVGSLIRGEAPLQRGTATRP